MPNHEATATCVACERLPACLAALAAAAAQILRDYTRETLASLTDYGYPKLLKMHNH